MSKKVIRKTELIRSIYDKNREDVVTLAAAGRIFENLVTTIGEQLAEGNKVVITGFGTFDTRDRKEREGRNLHTGETILVPKRRVPVFKAGQRLKDAVKE